MDNLDALLHRAHENADMAQRLLWTLEQRIPPRIVNTDKERTTITRALAYAKETQLACEQLLARV